MIPTFTPVEWAIIASGAFSLATLVFVVLDLYWSHIATKRSDISIRPSSSRNSSHYSRDNRISSPCTLINEGERSGVVRAKDANIRLEPSGSEFSWREMQEMESSSPPLVTIDHLDNHSVSANSTLDATVKFYARGTEKLHSLMEDGDSLEISATIDVEDNVGQYQIQYSDEIDLN